ncbi:MAG: acyl-homoserine-lactone acylase, partial [Thermoleophilaceae bacterium]|nr:acyl-homoserine-lactone acylase [Thermoleophilaceae bacterium]
NHWLARTGVAHIKDPACHGQPWVKPIEKIDAYRRFYQLALLASSGVAIDGIGSAQPPTPPIGGGPLPLPSAGQLPTLGERLPLGGIGSNAIGLGREATKNGRGALLGNPHFPWDGSERFFEAQLTIPHKIDVQGASLLGVPIILIGHTPKMTWSHTVSTAFRFTPFEEKLVPGSPTTYLVDGQPRKMEEQTVAVQARRPDGTLEERKRTLYSTAHGPVFTSILGLPLFPWTASQAYAMGDANAGNFRYLNHFFETDRARSTDELLTVLRRNQGIPWVNTIASDSRGRALYADISVTPNVTDQKAASCNTALGAATFAALRLPVLDGSRSQCDWGRDADAAQPGIFGPGNMPHLFRNDYVINSNDSYWLSNPKQPLTGFARIIGDEGTARSLRTRLGLVMVDQRLSGADKGPGRKFDLADIQNTVFNDRQYAGELWRPELVAMCRQMGETATSRGPVDVAPACPVLEKWEVRDDLASRGALLFRRFASRALAIQGGPYRQAFDPKDPVNTPNGLNTENPEVRRALGEAVADLNEAHIPLDAPLGEWQYEMRGSERIPMHGGPGTLGVFNALNVPWVPGQGYPDVPHGSSFVMAVSFGKGCPKTRTILTYSQSTDSKSKYFADQTRMFSNKRWVTLPYCERSIAKATLRTTRLH